MNLIAIISMFFATVLVNHCSASEAMCAVTPFSWFSFSALSNIFRASLPVSCTDDAPFCAHHVDVVDRFLMSRVALYAFGFELDSYTEETLSYPIEGVRIDEFDKVAFAFPIIVEHNNVKIKTLAVYESDCSTGYMSPESLQAVGLTSRLRSLGVHINGVNETVKKAPERYQHINIIGESFLAANSLHLQVDSDPEGPDKPFLVQRQ